jgi:hypothetical protein
MVQKRSARCIQNHPTMTKNHTTAPPFSSNPGITTPEFIRLPKPGTNCPICGLGRTTMYQLCVRGLVQSKSLRERGKLRGTRLVDFDSLMKYIRSRPDSFPTKETLSDAA